MSAKDLVRDKWIARMVDEKQLNPEYLTINTLSKEEFEQVLIKRIETELRLMADATMNPGNYSISQIHHSLSLVKEYSDRLFTSMKVDSRTINEIIVNRIQSEGGYDARIGIDIGEKNVPLLQEDSTEKKNTQTDS